MIHNKNGLSLIGLLIAALLIGLLLKLMIAPYQKTAANANQSQHIQTQSQAKQTVDNVRATLKQAEQAAAKRAEVGMDF